MSLNWADWTIIAVVAISSLISIKRGFVKEAISLAAWSIAFFIAVAFHERFAILLEQIVSAVSLRYMMSFAALFAATLIAGTLLKYLVGELIKVTGLSGADRLLGMAFGLARGAIVVMAVLILLPMVFPVDRDLWWQQSALIPQFLLVEQWCKDTFADVLEFGTAII